MFGNCVQFIAEVKPRLPSGWQSALSWGELFAIANEHGDMISVHTDPRWGGSMGLIARARRLTKKPILAKGIHATDDLVAKAFGAGADYVLVVGRIPTTNPERCLIEPRTVAELRALPPTTMAVWNNRDLGRVDQPDNRKQETFA
jgi:indole-3-glycerol phosphate synthase